MLCILAIFAFLATTNADLAEFDPLGFQYSGLIIPHQNPSPACLINPVDKVPFRLSVVPDPNHAAFEPDALPDPSTVHELDEVCGYLLGIYIDELERTFCNLTAFAIESFLDQSEPHFSRFHLQFHTPKTGPFYLVVPVYKVPSAVENYSQNDLMVWAHERGLAVVRPVDLGNLLDANLSGLLTVQLEWLTRLVRFGVLKSAQATYFPGTTIVEPTYVTRPVLITQHTFDMITNVVFSNQMESGGSNEPTY